METNRIIHGDCLSVLKDWPDNFFDSCVTDPPYGISFMNKHWDYDVPKVEVWKEILRVLKPGGHLLCACGTRTQHRMAINIEDAGFEIRDVITWHYGSGFPKSLNISMAIDKQAGAEREIIGKGKYASRKVNDDFGDVMKTGLAANPKETAPATDEAKEWNGWGTALKPATEFWTLARKPLQENTVAENVLKYGTGGINIDGSRIDTDDDNRPNAKGGDNGLNGSDTFKIRERFAEDQKLQGRFPSNLILDDFTGKILDEQSGNRPGYSGNGNAAFGEHSKGVIEAMRRGTGVLYNDEGGASRFFYCPKADNFERNKGLEKFDAKYVRRDDGQPYGMNTNQFRPDGTERKEVEPKKNNHPTVKPIDLLRYLVKLITPKGGVVLDPFIGSGTTGIGAKLELINYIGIERELEYCKIAEARIAAWNPDKYKPQTLF